MVRKGARLTLRYDASTNAFTGTVENTTSATLAQVRVEIHRVTGVELVPTPDLSLASGQRMDVSLDAGTQPFSR